MTTLSSALQSDLEFALSRYGITTNDIPRDHEGMSIDERLSALDQTGESYRYSPFKKTDLRSPEACPWDLFPENPATVDVQSALVDEVGELLHDEATFHTPPHVPMVSTAELPRTEHVNALEQLLAYIDGEAERPEISLGLWSETQLIEDALNDVPPLREAQAAVALRETLVHELTAGHVPPASAVFVRRALDSETDGLRSADITLATHSVVVANVRDRLELALASLREHYAVAERIREVRDTLDRIDEALHWPGDWWAMPKLATR